MPLMRFVLMSRFLGLAAVLVSIARAGWAVRTPRGVTMAAPDRLIDTGPYTLSRIQCISRGAAFV